MDHNEIRAAESHDPTRFVAHEAEGVGTSNLDGELLTAGGSLLEQDAITKMNAGALLTFAVWSLPKDIVLPLLKDAPQAFTHAYMAACEAYGVGGR